MQNIAKGKGRGKKSAKPTTTPKYRDIDPAIALAQGIKMYDYHTDDGCSSAERRPLQRSRPSTSDEENTGGQDEKRPKLGSVSPPSPPLGTPQTAQTNKPGPIFRVKSVIKDDKAPAARTPLQQRPRLSPNSRVTTPPPTDDGDLIVPQPVSASTSMTSQRSSPSSNTTDTSKSGTSQSNKSSGGNSLVRSPGESQDSTTYAEIEETPMETRPIPTPTPISPQGATTSTTTYATALNTPAPSPPASPAPLTNPPGPHKTINATSPQTNQQATRLKGYPPIVLERHSKWPKLFTELTKKLGHSPNAKAFNKGIRFLPKSEAEFRGIQRYLAEAAKSDPQLAWHCYSLNEERPTKIAIRGLPPDTEPQDVIDGLKALDFPATAARYIPRKNEGLGIYHVALEAMNRAEKERLLSTTKILNLNDLRIEAWRGITNAVPQCFRCQGFGHSSTHCHRKLRCVKCGESHIGESCVLPPGTLPTCANCKGRHTANSRTCPIYRGEARKRNIKLRANIPPPHEERAEQYPNQRPRYRPPSPIERTRDLGPAFTSNRFATLDPDCEPNNQWGSNLQPRANPATERSKPRPNYNNTNSRRRRARQSRNSAFHSQASTPTPILTPNYQFYAAQPPFNNSGKPEAPFPWRPFQTPYEWRNQQQHGKTPEKGKNGNRPASTSRPNSTSSGGEGSEQAPRPSFQIPSIPERRKQSNTPRLRVEIPKPNPTHNNDQESQRTTEPNNIGNAEKAKPPPPKKPEETPRMDIGESQPNKLTSNKTIQTDSQPTQAQTQGREGATAAEQPPTAPPNHGNQPKTPQGQIPRLDPRRGNQGMHDWRPPPNMQGYPPGLPHPMRQEYFPRPRNQGPYHYGYQGPTRDPMTIIMGALIELLTTIAAGGDLRLAAMRAMTILGVGTYG